MKDLDFDELDRAVNSLIGATPTDGTKAPDVTTPVVETPAPAPTVSPTSEPVTPTSAVTTQPLAAKRSSGRFMDVVHPSSDMRSSTPVAPVAPVSRQGLSLQPVNRPTPSPIVAESDVPAIVNTPAEEKPALTEWPDPLDMAQSESSDEITISAPSTPSALDAAMAASLSDANMPLDSPFIPDAKVEKRPLGAFSSDTSSSSETLPSLDLSEEINKDIEPASETDSRENHPMSSDMPLPAELQNDLLSIESNESTEPVVAPVSTMPSEPVDNKTISIPQQYEEQPSTGDKPAGAIFDVEAYRKPIAKQKKKTSPWLFIVWILLLVIVGAGAGAAVYYFVLPSL